MNTEQDYLRLIAAMLHQLGGRFELQDSSIKEIQEPFGVSITPIMGFRVLSLEMDGSQDEN